MLDYHGLIRSVKGKNKILTKSLTLWTFSQGFFWSRMVYYRVAKNTRFSLVTSLALDF